MKNCKASGHHKMAENARGGSKPKKKTTIVVKPKGKK